MVDQSIESMHPVQQSKRWYWLVLAFSATAATIAMTVPDNMFPEAYLKYLFGTPLVIFLPGYSLLRALFPEKMDDKNRKNNLDLVERSVLSVGVSFAVVPVLGLLLDLTPWGINRASVILSLIVFTVAVSTTAIIRESKKT